MTGFIGPPSMYSSIEKQKDNTEALLVKLLERLGLENSTGSHSNPKPSVNPTVYYTSANTSPTGYPYFQAQPIPQVGPPPIVNCRFVMPAQHATPAQQVNSTQQVTSGQPTKLAHAFTTGTLHDPDAWNMDTARGDLYPVTAPSLVPHVFLVSQHTWHQRLGHPGREVLRHLVSNNFISCNKEKPPVLCHACQLGKHVRLPFCDHGGEFDNRNFHKLFADNGIQFRFSCPNTSQQNEALNVATHLLNFLPSTAIHNEIPYTRLFGTNPDYSLLRTIGCLCYPHLDTNHKLEPRATPSIYLGQAFNHRGYRCLDLKTNNIIISRHVTFDKTVFPYGSTLPALPPTYTFLDDIPDIIPPAIPTNPAVQLPPEPITPIHNTPIQHHPDTAQLPTTPQQLSPAHYLADGTLSRYKARLVASGSTKLEGVDVNETFSSVVKPGTIRLPISLAVFSSVAESSIPWSKYAGVTGA
ncbi:ribonuclease H-like domain-containing protein [Tanacetum coccineum]